MEAEVEETGRQEETRAAGVGYSAESRDNRAFLRSTAQHLASLLETTEAQLEILTRELLPPLKESADVQKSANDSAVNADTQTHNSHGESASCAAALESFFDSRTSSVPFTADPISSPPSISASAAPLPASPATVASSVLRNRNASYSSADFLETNLLLARHYYKTCCSLSRMLHEEIESLDLTREGVCGNRVYNAVLQVENLQMLREERRNLALLRKALSE